MKKLLLLSALLLTSFAYSQASGSTQVSIVISEVYSIEVNQASVSIPINTVDHMVNGNGSENPNHLTITSSGGYQVEAKGQTNFTGSNGYIDISKLGISLSDNGGTEFLTNFPLSLNNQEVITSPTGSLQRNIDVDYIVQGGEYLTQLEAGTYTATIIYTLTLD